MDELVKIALPLTDLLNLSQTNSNFPFVCTDDVTTTAINNINAFSISGYAISCFNLIFRDYGGMYHPGLVAKFLLKLLNDCRHDANPSVALFSLQWTI